MNELARLPGIGMRSAERIAFHLLKQTPEEAMKLAEAIRDVKTRIRHCSVCYNLTEQDPCAICADPSRDQGARLHRRAAQGPAGAGVDGPVPRRLPRAARADLAAGRYRARRPDDRPAHAPAGVRRRSARSSWATNPTMEGDGTALYIQSLSAAASPTSRSPAWPAACPPAATSNTPTRTSLPTRSAGDSGCSQAVNDQTQTSRRPRSACP